MTSFRLQKPNYASMIITLLMVLPISACNVEKFGEIITGNIIYDTSIQGTETFTTSRKPNVSQYLEEVTLHSCDIDNPLVQIIETNSDWMHINDPDKRVFCVSPGDYTSIGQITLNSSGTIEAPRYILLNDGRLTHPGKLADIDNANVHLLFDNASYWIIDRISTQNITEYSSRAMTFINKSHNNTINKHYINNCFQGIFIVGESHNNIIQNSRLSNETLEGRKYDGVGIALGAQNSWDTIAIIKNTKIVNNEIFNYNDGIQLVRSNLPEGNWRPTNFEGTIIDSNQIYIDSSIYTDGNGNHDPNGDFAYAENAIDLKAGSDDNINPVIISNNHMWGYRVSDKTDSSISGSGSTVVSHFNVANTNFLNNYIFDSVRGLAGSTLINSNVTGNTFYKIKDFHSFFYDTDNVLFSKNIIVGDSTYNWWVTAWIAANENTKDTRIIDNVIVNIPRTVDLFDNTNYANENYFYKVDTPLESDLNAHIFSSISFAEHSKYTFTVDNFTNSPKEITLYNVLPTENSPHFSVFE